MDRYDTTWVDKRVSQTVNTWHQSAAASLSPFHYSSEEQKLNEEAYDEALDTVERDLESTPQTPQEQGAFANRAVASFARFSAKALGLTGDQISLLTDEFVPIGTELARWARQFDPALEMDAIIQAARNAWTACGLQPLLGVRIELTPAILGYSLLYPYSDNYLDNEEIAPAAKLEFSQRFRCRLLGQELVVSNHRERSIWSLVDLIEAQYPRQDFPPVYDCLLAIHHAQEQSIGQLQTGFPESEDDCLRLSCAKGGTSVLADACLARGMLNAQENSFAFDWGVLLQLGDDLQDLRDDIRRGSLTLFSLTAAAGKPLDGLTLQLLNFSENVGALMDNLPDGTATLKSLLKMSWRSLIIRAIADSHEFFSRGFVREAERQSPFRFQFLRERSARLARRHGLYAALFDALVEPGAGEPAESEYAARA